MPRKKSIGNSEIALYQVAVCGQQFRAVPQGNKGQGFRRCGSTDAQIVLVTAYALHQRGVFAGQPPHAQPRQPIGLAENAQGNAFFVNIGNPGGLRFGGFRRGSPAWRIGAQAPVNFIAKNPCAYFFGQGAQRRRLFPVQGKARGIVGAVDDYGLRILADHGRELVHVGLPARLCLAQMPEIHMTAHAAGHFVK